MYDFNKMLISYIINMGIYIHLNKMPYVVQEFTKIFRVLILKSFWLWFFLSYFIYLFLCITNISSVFEIESKFYTYFSNLFINLLPLCYINLSIIIKTELINNCIFKLYIWQGF